MVFKIDILLIVKTLCITVVGYPYQLSFYPMSEHIIVSKPFVIIHNVILSNVIALELSNKFDISTFMISFNL